MRFSRTVVLSLSALTLLGAVSVMTPARAERPEASAAGTYKVDPVHSTIIFGIEHMGVGYFYGRVNGPYGEYTFDPDDASACHFEVMAKTDSIDTGAAKRDNHLKSGDFFNAAEFPEISFKSTKVQKSGTDTYKVTGDLTMHGVTKPVTAELELIGAKEMRGGYKSGFRGTFVVNRSDWGIDYMPGGLGEQVAVMIGIEGGK